MAGAGGARDGGGAQEEAEEAARHVLQEHRPDQGDQAESGPRVQEASRHPPPQSEVSVAP